MNRLAVVLYLLPCVAAAKDIVIHAGRLIDGTGAAPRTQVSILIKDEKITGVQAGFVTPPGAEVIDLSKGIVLPGFIDAHKHVGSGGGRRGIMRATWSTVTLLSLAKEAARCRRASGSSSPCALSTSARASHRRRAVAGSRSAAPSPSSQPETA